ncbi:MAG: 3-deoxy-8-phosphooctulonate synthase [Chlorobi bacterium]|nr:3-deoxy-8-phosphooctulonate synthase [Chlorobiota bacterium]MCI0715021.1 3-deoxy-8-phosphooctulonate synthase [Chlorobiota bacterium]
MTKEISVIIDGKTVSFVNKSKFFLIAGPCAVESERLSVETAKRIKDISLRLKLPFIFKASYKKANRTSGSSFRSIGVIESLDILATVREKVKVPVLTDIHSEIEAEIAAEYVDVLQIPAFLSRQTEILEAAGETGKIVNIKKGQFLSPNDMIHQIKKVESTGNKKIMLTERGTTFGYQNLVVDMRSFEIMKKFGYPVVFDATHSVQMPSKENGVSGGNPEFIEPLSKAAVAVGINGLFIETHPNPKKALSDASSMLPLNKLESILKRLLSIHLASSQYV